jgi:hypothetical protein
MADDNLAVRPSIASKHGRCAAAPWLRLYDEYPAYQLVLWGNEARDEVLGRANTIPCAFDGTVEGLPHGIDEVVATGLP